MWRHRLGWRNHDPRGAIAAGDYDSVYLALTRGFNPLARGGIAIARALTAYRTARDKNERARTRAVLTLLLETVKLQGGDAPRSIMSLPAVGDKPAPPPKRYINRRTGRVLSVAESRKATQARWERRASTTRAYLANLGRALLRESSR